MGYKVQRVSGEAAKDSVKGSLFHERLRSISNFAFDELIVYSIVDDNAACLENARAYARIN